MFNGSNSWVNLGIKNYAYPTLEAVVEVDKMTNFHGIIENMQSGGYALGVAGSTMFMQVYMGGTYVQTGWYDVPPEYGKKYHMVGMYDGTAVRLYVNGVEVRTQPATGSITTAGSNTVLALGTNPYQSSAGGDFLDGVIYYARIYDGALTAEEVYQNYLSSLEEPYLCSELAE